MKKIGIFKVYGTIKGDNKSHEIDELSIVGKPNVLRDIGIFLINCSHEMEVNGVEHFHIQDFVSNFSYSKHADIIGINSEKIEKIIK